MTNWFDIKRDQRQDPLQLNFNSTVSIDDDIFNNPLKHAIETVEQISKQYPPPYSVMMSGGVDSQSMVYAWMLSGLDFNIIHYRYDRWNRQDTDHVVKFLKKHDIESKLDLRTFDILDFLTSDQLAEYAVRYDCASPQILTHIRLIEQTPGTVIIGGNNIQLDIAGLNYSVAGLLRFKEKTQQNVIPLFHLQNPNFAYSLFQKDVNWKGMEAADAYSLKCKLYKSAKFEIMPQISKKTGFEKIKIFFDNESISPNEKLKWRNKPSKRPFDIMFRYRLLDTIGDYSDAIRLTHHNMINRLINGNQHENTNRL